MKLNTPRRRWTNDVTERMANCLDDMDFGEQMADIIRDCRMNHDSEFHAYYQMSGAIDACLTEEYRRLDAVGGPMRYMLLRHPRELVIDNSQIVDVYLEKYDKEHGQTGKTTPKASGNARSKTSANRRAGSPAGTRSGRC